MNFKEIIFNTADSTSKAHTANLEKDSEYNFVYDDEIAKAMIKKKCLHQMSYIRKYLFVESEKLITHEVCTSFFSKFGKTFPHIQECIEGMIRSAKSKTYKLYNNVDNDVFRTVHMPVNKGENDESYWDDNSRVNDWRTILDHMITAIRDEFMVEINNMKSDAAKMDREEFILDQKYISFYCDKTKNEVLSNKTKMTQNNIFNHKKIKLDSR